MKSLDQTRDISTLDSENRGGEVEVVEEGYPVQLIVFKLGDEEYALPIDQVKEIVLTPRVSEVPQTPNYVLGIANIRGSIITVMDMERKFSLGAKNNELKSGTYTMVIESSEYQVGILVKNVPNTLSVMSSKIDSSSNIMQYATMDENVIKGVAKMKDRMIILLDAIKMMETGELQTKVNPIGV